MKFIFKLLEQVISETQLEDGVTYEIGRHKDCHFILEDETLSRKHIKIYQSEDSQNWVIQCLSSSGGLIFEGKEVEGLELEDSASFTLKNYSLEFILEDPQEKALEKALEKDPSQPQNLPVSSSSSSEEKSHDQKENTEATQVTRMLDTNQLVYSLYIYIEDESADHVVLDQRKTWTVGRSKDCDIYIDYKSLSRNHMKITNTGAQFSVEALESANPSYLNEQEMEVQKAYPLSANDHIVIGELNIVFEVRDKNFEQKISKLPAVSSSETNPNQPNIMPFPKVVLEEETNETEEEQGQGNSFFNKKRIIIFAIGFLVLVVLFFSLQKPNEEQIKTNNDDEEKATAIKKSYDLARQFLQEKKYQFCIDEIEKLHTLTSYYEDSVQILTACKTAAHNQKVLAEAEEKEKKKKETEAKIKKLAQECLDKEPTFQTINDVNSCASEILQLDPSNHIIASIKRRLEEKELQKKIKEQKIQNQKKWMASKRFLFKKAQKLDASSQATGHAKDLLKTVQAYNKFIVASKGIKSLSQLRQTAQQRADEIQKKHDKISKELYSQCEQLINTKKMKLAYYECKKILTFKPEDPKALGYMKQASSFLKNKLQNTFEKSVMAESLSRIEIAQNLWKEIMKTDIPEGHYYKKAKVLLQKYE